MGNHRSGPPSPPLSLSDCGDDADQTEQASHQAAAFEACSGISAACPNAVGSSGTRQTRACLFGIVSSPLLYFVTSLLLRARPRKPYTAPPALSFFRVRVPCTPPVSLFFSVLHTVCFSVSSGVDSPMKRVEVARGTGPVAQRLRFLCCSRRH